MKKNANKGFSLVELIIVIAIMAVLIGVLAPQFIKQVEKSKESTDLQNIEEYKVAVETAVAEGGVTADVTITITGGTTATFACNVDLSEYGLNAANATNTLKSKKWPASATYTYSSTAYTWSNPTGHADYYDFAGNPKPSGGWPTN